MDVRNAVLTRQQRRATERAERKARRRAARVATGALAVGSVLAAGSAAAATFTVTNLNDSGAGSLRQAVLDANANPGADTVNFQSGLSGTITLTSGEIPITESVTIDGPGLAVVTISGNDSSRIFNVSDGNSGTLQDVTIGGLSLVHGKQLGGDGAALSVSENLVLHDVAITNSVAGHYGGALAAAGPLTLTVTNSTMSDNVADNHGGAVSLDNVTATFSHVTISGNQALFGGGGIYQRLGSVQLTNSVITGNRSQVAAGPGGGIFTTLGSTSVVDSVVSSNSVGSDGRGGGFYVTDAALMVKRTTISGNTAAVGGGMSLYGSSTAALENVTMANNSAISGYGGAIDAARGTQTTVNLSTIAYNGTAPSSSYFISVAGSLTLTNSIVPGGTYSTVESYSYAGDHPQLAPLANNNSTIVAGAPGSTQVPQTMMPLCGSPVINAGDPAFTPPPSTDERGLPRVANGRVDIGAVEVNPGSIQFSTASQNVAENAGSATITVTRTGGADDAVSVSYATADGTAKSTASGVGTPDYTASSGTLTWADGDSASKTISVPITDDTVLEGNETFTATLSSPTCNATLGSTTTQTVTIVDNDPQPSISINSVAQNEGNSGTSNLVFTVSLSNPSTQTITVNYATANGTATAGSDYTATSGSLTFTPGQTSQTISVPVIGDTLSEADETFTVNLSGPTNATIAAATGTGTGTILNDDPAPSVSINSVSQPEGNSGTTNMTFAVTLSAASGQTVTVNYATANGTATAGSDYTATSGTLTFTPGQTSQTINVPVIGDTLNEADETFTVNLSSPVNASVVTATGTGTIQNDDAVPSVSINSVSQPEGNSGTTNMAFTVTLSAASGQTVTVNYATANGTATAGSDYTATSGTLTFTPGQTAQTISVPIIGDTANEPDETFTVTLSTPSNATIATATGTGTIQNDDGVPLLSINSVAQPEGNSGTTNMSFTVTLSPASGQTVTVSYATANGTATAGSDYTATSGTLTFAPGVTTQTINVPIVGDTLNEPDEAFTVTLSSPSNATIATATGTGTIQNDDGVPLLSINSAAQPEGNSGTTNMSFTVTLSPASGQTVTVNYATTNGTATAGSDYTATSGTLTFAPGVTTQTINVPIIGDTTYEPDETFTVTLSGAANATIATATGTGTIQNDDPGNADLAVTQTPPAQAFATQNGTFAVTVSNGGPNAASNVVLTDVIPPNSTLVSATPSQGTCSGTTTVTCNVGALASGGSATVSLTVNFTAPGPSANSVSVTAAPQPDPNPANNTSSAPVTVQLAAAIPTLSETVLLALATLLGAIGAWFTGRKS